MKIRITVHHVLTRIVPNVPELMPVTSVIRTSSCIRIVVGMIVLVIPLLVGLAETADNMNVSSECFCIMLLLTRCGLSV